MGKNVAVFVDVANIFYAAKAAGVDIDYVLLLRAATAGRDLVRAYAYTGLDPDNENQRNFHSFLARHDYRVVSKDIRKYGDGKVKANLDIELVVDMMKTARNLDVAVVVSGDGDFAPAIRAVQETGVRVEVISFRGNTSSDLIDVADKFTDITQLAKVERGSTASGRRVATDEEDLSMTEVPEKESEGTGRGRGRGRGRTRTAERPLEAPAGRASRDGRSREGRIDQERAASSRAGERGEATVIPVVALPGERLARAAAADEASTEEAEVEGVEVESDETGAGVGSAGGADQAEAEGQHRRRRRRGGRGRGRGRGREEGAETDQLEGGPGEDLEPSEEEIEPVRRAPRPAAFGSVWDSQIGVPAGPVGTGAPSDEEFDDEPEIPEYLLAEQRRSRGGGPRDRGRGGGRGRGGAYAAAVDRERYGGSRPAGGGRFGEAGNRGQGRVGPGPRDMRRPAPVPAQRHERPRVERVRADEPWSEVPPELEQLLRSQFAQKEARASQPAAATREPATGEAASAQPSADAAVAGAKAAPAARRRTRKAEPAGGAAGAAAQAAPEAPAAVTEETPRRRTRSVAAPATRAPAAPPAPAESSAESPRRRTRKTAVAADAAGKAGEGVAPAVGAATGEAPKRRTRRQPAAGGPTATPAEIAPADAAAPKVPRRRTRAAAPAGD